VRNRVNTAVLVGGTVERGGSRHSFRLPDRCVEFHGEILSSTLPALRALEPEPRPTKQGRYPGVQTASNPHRAAPSKK
jgi:hypothetical protein